MEKTRKIALTGIMGAGKSSVIAQLQELGITVLDCDEINRDLMQKGAKGYEQIITVFQSDILDKNGNLDTKKLSDVIFVDQTQKQRLEQILHPLIQAEIMRFCEQCKADIVVVEVPLLFEVHWEKYFDEIWVVTCDEETLLKRLEQYRHVTRAEAMRRLSYQMSQEEKCAKADVVFYNNKDKAYLKEQIVKELKRIREE